MAKIKLPFDQLDTSIGGARQEPIIQVTCGNSALVHRVQTKGIFA